ncbi:MAG: TetR/AcrR family transcriptional regulator [Spirochaetes bacterium]|nr:TetR/AcrR family transcriptional regulator [Spirochaetota bacterium]
MPSKRDAVKKRIIDATIACIEKIGVSSISIRTVAKQAGVNTASINYYFGTKENLLEETFKSILDHFFFDIQELFTFVELHSYSLLKVFFTFLLKGIHKYPRLVQTLIFNERLAPKYRESFLRYFSLYIQEIARRILTENPSCSPIEATLRGTQMLSVVLSTCLPFQVSVTAGFDLQDPSSREQYLDLLISRYIDWIPPDRIEAQRELVQRYTQQLFEGVPHDQE